MTRGLLAIAGLAVLPLTAGGREGTPPQPTDPAALLLRPEIRLNGDELRELRDGRTVVRSLSVSADHHVGLVLLARIETTPDRFVEKIRRSADLWKDQGVPVTGRFSEPARPADVETMRLPRGDLEALRRCKPGDCDVKLSDAEIARLQAAIARGGAAWREAAQNEFRQVVLDRIAAYRRSGLRGLQPPHDHDETVDLHAVFSRLLAESEVLAQQAPEVGAFLERYPAAPLPPQVEDHLYWLLTTETPKPTIQGVHVTLQRRAPDDPVEVVVISRQIFATHYVNGSLATSALVRDPENPSRRYLVYLNRSASDALGGFLAGLKRFFVERRIRGAARSAFDRLKRRFES
jgi:hypothetical protein